MDIQELENTPNQNAKRFVLSANVVPVFQSLHFTPDTEVTHDLAIALLAVQGVSEVFLQGNWVTVTRKSEVPWEDLLRKIAVVLRSYEPETFSNDTTERTSLLPKDDPRVPLIRLVIEQEIMPYLNSHGGSLELLTLEESILQVRYQGACSGCPASETGTLLAIQTILQREVDPTLTVEAL